MPIDDFKPIWDEKHKIEQGRREKLREAMKEYDETIYRPAKEQLKKDCEKLGHSEEGKYWDNGFGWQNSSCNYCDKTLRKWLDHEELKVENGQAIYIKGQGWVKIDGTILKLDESED